MFVLISDDLIFSSLNKSQNNHRVPKNCLEDNDTPVLGTKVRMHASLPVLCYFCVVTSVVDPHRQTLDVLPPLNPIFFIYMQFKENLA